MLGKEEEEEEEVGVVEDMDKALEEVAVDLDMDKVKVSCCGEVTSATTILPAATENQSQDIMVLRISVLTNYIVPIRDTKLELNDNNNVLSFL